MKGDINFEADELKAINPIFEDFAKLMKEGFTIVIDLRDPESGITKLQLRLRAYRVRCNFNGKARKIEVHTCTCHYQNNGSRAQADNIECDKICQTSTPSIQYSQVPRNHCS